VAVLGHAAMAEEPPLQAGALVPPRPEPALSIAELTDAAPHYLLHARQQYDENGPRKYS
jgi:hypothetical protein